MRVFQSIPVGSGRVGVSLPVRGARVAYEPWFPIILALIIFVAVMLRGAP
jgi:hypothetical protein